MSGTSNPLPLMRQCSRDAAATAVERAAPEAAPPSPCASELAACAAARSAKDLDGCLRAARAALHKDVSCGKAWAFLCWALFELRRYEDARVECLRALAYRSWAARDREGMAALRTSCLLLSQLTPTVGDRLRDGWYKKRLRDLYESHELLEYGRLVTGEEMPRGAGRLRVDKYELSLLDNVPAGGLRDVQMGGDGGERDVPAGLLEGGDPANEQSPQSACIGGPNFPIEQALGGVVYLKHTMLPFHCDQRHGPEEGRVDRRTCYRGNGPCRRCRNMFPVPTHRFPSWSVVDPLESSITQPHADMDVFYSTDSVPARLHQQLTAQLDALAGRGGSQFGTFPMPQYHTVIDPNLAAVDRLWVPTEFDVMQAAYVPIDSVLAVELACVAATGQRLPFGFGHAIARLARGTDSVRAECAVRSTIPGLDPHRHVKLHAATQKLMGAALPMLARLRRPALLLPGPLQAVVKAQRIVVDAGDTYAGVWHEDGLEEHVAAVVLYYFRTSPSLRGGSLEFCSKQSLALWSGDAGGDVATLGNTADFAASLPRCQVPVRKGTLVCFSNYAAVHRVLRMEAAGGGGSREFFAFFIIDQRHPLPTPRTLPPLPERIEACKALLARQLQPCGKFGFNANHVYSTGNGSVADVGWVRVGGGTRVEETYPDAASLIDRLNLQPPAIERGASMMLDGPRPPPDQTVAYNPQSEWAEAWVGEGQGAVCVYIDLNYGNGLTATPPADGVSEVLCFPRGMAELAEYAEAKGFWCEEEVLQARIHGLAIELVVDDTSAWVLPRQLAPIRRLRGLEEGSRCELTPFLAQHNEEEDDDERGQQEVEHSFQEEAWPDCLAFILAPHDTTLTPLERARMSTNYFPASKKRAIVAQLFNIKVNGVVLGYRALEKAADAAMAAVNAMPTSH